MNEQDRLTVYTTDRCGDCVAAKRALDAWGVEYHEVRLEEDAQAIAFVESVNAGRRSVPTLAFGHETASLSRFSPRRLADFLAVTGLLPRPSDGGD